MKKKFVWFTIAAVTLFLCVFSIPNILNAQDEFETDLSTGKQKSVFAGVGYTFSDYDGPVLDFGLEMQFARHLFAQVILDYYLNPLPDDEDITGLDYTLIGFNLYGVYKFTASEKFNVFVKGGFHMTGIKAKGEYFGVPATTSQTKFGAGAGLGMELMLSEKWGLLFGGTYKILFADTSPSWIKLYGGILYRFY